MKIIGHSLPISSKYDSPIFEAVAIQIVLSVFGLLLIDPVGVSKILGIALVAFWGAAVVLIWRHPQSPTRLDLGLIRFGYLPVIAISAVLTCWIWHLRGL
ncbi:MAG: hypothetical protein ABSA47_12850 [Verrucomicrobiota bacterium]|jgi:hypothetical protein